MPSGTFVAFSPTRRCTYVGDINGFPRFSRTTKYSRPVVSPKRTASSVRRVSPRDDGSIIRINITKIRSVFDVFPRRFT